MKHIVYIGLVSISFSAIGQTIEVPAGTPLTVQGNLNLPTGFSIQYNSQNYMQAPPAGSNNTYLGLGAGRSAAGQGNSFIGYSAGSSNAGGNNNTFLGAAAGYTNGAGFGNLFMGQQAGYFNTGGNNNAFLGRGAGYANQTGAIILSLVLMLVQLTPRGAITSSLDH